MARLTFSGSAGVVYDQHFPALKSLTLWPQGFGKLYSESCAEKVEECEMEVEEFWERNGPYYETFLPLLGSENGVGQVFKSLQS